jgi:phenylpropionate dioxygenase-like ring-hydroxylating dioxygenase large terminal subunit
MNAPGSLTARHELDVRRLIDGDRVHRLIYLDEAVFEAELARIFGRSWVYVGHESEVPAPGDYKTTTIGRQPVILVRTADRDGDGDGDGDGGSHEPRDGAEDGGCDGAGLIVLFNRCTHRAATVCQERRGHASHFRCPYHGWMFRTDGTLLGATHADGYDDPDFHPEDFTLGRVPRVDSYRGFVFASLAPQGPSLVEHLGNAAPYLDLFVDLSPTGRVKVGTPGENHYAYPGNWKVQSENGVDGYHANIVHLAYLEGAAPDHKALRPFAGRSAGLAVDLGNGHGLLDQRPVLADVFERQATSNPVGRAHRDALVERLGPERAREVLRTNGGQGFNLLVFPNLLLIQYHLRVVQPRRVDWTEVELHPVLFDGDGDGVGVGFGVGDRDGDGDGHLVDELNTRRLRGHEGFYGPAGGGVPGDLEMFRRVQEGLAVEAVEWLSLERGRCRTTVGPHGERIGQITDEHPQRGFYRRWLQDMTGERP